MREAQGKLAAVSFARLAVWGPAALTLAVGLLLSIGAFRVTRGWQQTELLHAFEHDANKLAATLRTGLAGHLETLDFLCEFYVGSQKVERGEFHDFVDDALHRHGGYQALEWIPRVPASQRTAFEEAVRAEGFPDFHIHPLTEREEHFPVDFVVPYAGNEKAHGYDLASDPMRREALGRARDTGEMAATPPIRLIQETGDEPGLLVFIPIYRNGAPHQTTEQRREHLTGFVLGVFRIGNLVDSALHGLCDHDIDFDVCDETDPAQPQVIHRYCAAGPSAPGRAPGLPIPADPPTAHAGPQLTQRFDVAGRQWSLHCYPAPALAAAAITWAPLGVLAGGSMLTLLSAAYLGTLLGRSARVSRLVRQRTAELHDANRQLQQNLHRLVRLNRLLEEELPRSPDLGAKFKTITETIVELFAADFCRVWVTAPGDRCASGCMHAQVTEGPHACEQRDRCLHLVASAGRYTHIDGAQHGRVPLGCYKIGRVAAGQDARFLTNDVQHDPRVHDQAWACELGLVSFAGYRLCAADGTPIGVLALFSQHPISPAEDNLLEGVATVTSHVIQTARAEERLRRAYDDLESRVAQRTAELAARIRELKCLYGISRVLGESTIPWIEALRQTVELLPSGWQHPELAAARITLDGQVVQSPNFVKTSWKQAADILIHGQPAGAVEVCYLGPQPDADEGPFLTEERELLTAVAARLGHWVERSRAEQQVRTLKQQVEFILGGTHTGLDIIDAEFNLRYIDPEWEKVYGPPAGRKCYEYFMDRDEVCPGCGIVKALETKTVTVTEEILPKENNRPIQVTTIPFQTEEDEWLVAEVNVDITERKQAEAELEVLHRQLLDASRRAGMAEVASGVLHNVGNVLNSLNVSASLVADRLRQSRVTRLRQVADLVRAHAGNLAEFLAADDKGRLLPDYLIQLAEHLTAEQAALLQELDALTKNVEHIKHIITMQQSHARASAVAQPISIPELVEDVLDMNTGSFERHGIHVQREYAAVPIITVDKHAVLQVLVNLVKNAKEALRDGGAPDKTLTVRIAPAERGCVQIEIADNGVGIAPEIAARIWEHAFTTKRSGNGFGLHNSALAAQAIGGSLRVHSEGPGRGASFAFTIPITTRELTHA